MLAERARRLPAALRLREHELPLQREVLRLEVVDERLHARELLDEVVLGVHAVAVCSECSISTKPHATQQQ